MSKEKLRKQFLVQVIQTLIAICIVFMVKTISAKQFLTLKEYCTSDIVLAFCSGFLGAFLSRWSEHWWEYVILPIIGLLFSAILYGVSLGITNEMVPIFIYVLAAYYGISIVLEYIICPIIGNKSKCKSSFSEEYIGYKYRKED